MTILSFWRDAVRRQSRPLAVAAAVAALSPILVAQQPGATFKASTKTVPVFVTVTDADGRLVPDLTADDFEILDNGKPQPLSVFAAGVQPIMVVMMLDRSGSMVGNFRLVREAAEQFVLRLLPGDRARIGSFSNRVQVDPRTFTSDQGELLGILRTQLQEAGPTPLWNAISVGMTALLHEEGRRVVLVFTDGVDAPMDRPTNQSLGDVTRRSREEDVMVYGVGLASSRGFGGRRGRGGYGGGFGGRPTMRGGSDKPDPGLAKIAAESGGGYFELESTDDLGATFARVADELHRQYALGFVPQKLDGKTHKLEVRVRRAGLVAGARKSYVARP